MRYATFCVGRILIMLLSKMLWINHYTSKQVHAFVAVLHKPQRTRMVGWSNNNNNASRNLAARFSTSHASSSSSEIESLLIPPLFSAEDYTLYTSDILQDGTLLSEDMELHQRIVSFGDVHGDLSKLIQFLVTAKVMSLPSSLSEALRNPKWCGGTTICIQVGDVLDRGANELSCIRLLSKLSKQASEEGGALVCLLGNHEALNAVGLFQYADPSGNLEFELAIGKPMDQSMGSSRWRIQYAGNEASRWRACEPGGLLSKTVFKNMKLAVQVGRSIFVHAGLTKDHLIQMGGISEMNTDAANWFVSSSTSNNDDGNFNSVQQVLDAAQSRSKTQSKTLPLCLGGGIGSPSPVWMREYSSPCDMEPNKASAQQMINDALSHLGDAQRMVMGHTPQSYINAALQGKAWRVDIGASRGVKNGTPEVLEIIHGGGDANGDTDDIHILTLDGKKIPGRERHVAGTSTHFNDIF
mmetsp:Transcript_16144/g.23047  ORF Transcript_16144/g.23047 Transcript_16144/m.23047 type:complete len:468 (+) Transcript_16144:115-1518(+)